MEGYIIIYHYLYIYIRSHLFKGSCICTWSDRATDSREGFAKKPTESGRQHFPPRGVRPCYQSSGLHAHGLNGYGYIYIVYIYICMPDWLGDWPLLILRYLEYFWVRGVSSWVFHGLPMFALCFGDLHTAEHEKASWAQCYPMHGKWQT